MTDASTAPVDAPPAGVGAPVVDAPVVADPVASPAARPDPARDAHLPRAAPTPGWRLVDRLVVVGFCICLLVPGLLLVAGRRSTLIENRPLLRAPAVTVSGLVNPAWYAALDRALADDDPLRPIAVRLRGEAYWHLGGTGNPAVIRGTDGWLFTDQEILPTCRLTAAAVAASLDRARAAFAAAGQEFRFVLAPDKHSIYPDRLDPAMPYGPACTDTQRPSMRAALDRRSAWIVDGWAALEAARSAAASDTSVYFTQDSHWTPTGALAAIEPLIESLGPGLWRADDIASGARRQVQMELARQIGLSHTETVLAPRIRPTVEVVRTALDLPVKTTAAKAVYRFTATGDRPLIPGRTVIVYDSFFGLNMAALAPFFEESIWIHASDLLSHPQIATMIGRADRVIFERVERSLYSLNVDRLLRPLVRTVG
jgi:hypothetical protein